MRNAVAITLSFVAMVFFALTAAGSLTEQSFGLTTVPASNACALLVTGVAREGSAMALSAGDTIDARMLTTHERLRLMVPRHSDAMMLPAHRMHAGGAMSMVMAMPSEHPSNDAAYLRLGGLALLMVLGLYVLWKGRDTASLGLGIFFTMMPAFFLSHAYAGLPDQVIIAVLFLAVILNLLGYFGLYLMVDALSAPAISGEVRYAGRAVALGALALACGILFSGRYSQVFTGCPSLLNVQIVLACYAAVIALCFVLLWLGLARSHPADRGRLRWVFWATVVGYSGPLTSFAFISVHQAMPLHGLVNLTFLAIPIGYCYAVLRHRVIDVGFVLNRALSLTLLTTAIVALFIVAESVIEHLTADHTESMLLQLAFSLGLGMAFNKAHARLEEWLERVLFKKRYLIEEAIKELEERIDRYPSEEQIASDVVMTVTKEFGLEGALFHRDGELYADRENRTALPLILRGRTYGTLLLMEDPSAESLSSEELQVLQQLTSRLAAAIAALRAEKYEQLLKEGVS
jgi:hypothetical protein